MNNDNLLELLHYLISCQSISPNDSGALPILTKYLNKINFVTRTISFGDGEERVDNLYGRLGNKGPNLCFAGHTDVVPTGPLTAWDSEPFTCIVRDDIVYGRGVVDMKGAIAAFIVAVYEVLNNEPNLLSSISLSIILTSDEEGIAVNGVKKLMPWLEELGEKIDACFIGEPVSREKVGDTIKIGARGSATFFLDIFGKQGHVAYHQYADNAISKLHKTIDLLRKHDLHKGDKVFEPSNMEITNIIVDNKVENVIPGKAALQFNVRYGNAHTADSLFREYRNILEAHLKPEEFDLRYHSSGNSFICESLEFVELVKNSIKETTDIEADVNTYGGTSDARFIHKYCPTLEVGLIGKTAHQANECSSLLDLYSLVKVYTNIITNFYKVYNGYSKKSLK